MSEPARKSPAWNSGLVLLTCGHIQRFRPSPPAKGESVFCRDCQAYRYVSELMREITLKCRNCKYTRRAGLGEEVDLSFDEARRLASKHVIRSGTHVVDVMKGTEVVETVAPDKGQGTLPFESVVRDRITANREHQNALRRYPTVTHDQTSVREDGSAPSDADNTREAGQA